MAASQAFQKGHIFDRDHAENFLQRRQPMNSFSNASSCMRRIPEPSAALRIIRLKPAAQGFADGSIEHQQFVDPDSPFVSGFIAVGASGRPSDSLGNLRPARGKQTFGISLFGSLVVVAGTKLANQSLAQDSGERRGNQVLGDSQVEQARHRRNTVIGVQGRQHQMAGLRGLQRDSAVSRSRISPTMMTFGVLPQDRPQATGERQARLLFT